jgi:glycosyltransferase involved in cell wall biosynthesis
MAAHVSQGELGPVDASIVVCTYNRAESLRTTLASLDRLDVAGLRVEAVIVDNNSADCTRAAFDEWQARTPLNARYCFEPRQGLSLARNTGVSAARGEVVAFTDDDVTVDSKWIRELVTAFSVTGAAAAGGKILPEWSGPVPGWLNPQLYSYLALVDNGDEPVEMTTPRIYGANFAVRADWLAKNKFDPKFGRTGGRLRIGEDIALLNAIMEQGGKLYYWPKAVVHHRIDPERMTKRYFRRWHAELGQMQGELMDPNHRRTLFNVPYRVYRELIEGSFRLGKACVKRQPTFYDELNMRRLAHCMYACIRRGVRVGIAHGKTSAGREAGFR